jgi:hypothetical protein
MDETRAAGADLIGGHHHAPATVYCASVSPNVRCVSTIVRRELASVSDNLRRKPAFIARRAVHHCAPLQVANIPIAASAIAAVASQPITFSNGPMMNSPPDR